MIRYAKLISQTAPELPSWFLVHQIAVTLVFLLQSAFSSPSPLPITSFTRPWGSNNPLQPPAVVYHLPSSVISYFA